MAEITTRRATIVDVAKHAGVSWKTVSRVVNRELNVGAETALKVNAAIAKLKYQPNYAARSLAGSNSFLIGVIVNNPSPHYIIELSRGAAVACRALGYQLSVDEIDLEDKNMIVDLDNNLSRLCYDGVILSPPVTDNQEILNLLDRHRIRYVRLAPATNESASDSIFADDATGVRELVQHLHMNGYNNYAIVKGPAPHSCSQVRYDAYVSELSRLGVAQSSIREYEGDFSFDAGLRAGRQLFADIDREWAVFACNDEMAAGVLAAAGQAGIKVPDQVAIAGFDDSAVARLVWPFLTTIHQPISDYGRIGVELLAGNRSRSGVRRVDCAVNLIVRHSVASRRRVHDENELEPDTVDKLKLQESP